MKKTLIYILLLILPLNSYSIDDIESPYKIRANFINGNIQSFGTKRIENIIGEPVGGFELAYIINSSLLKEKLWPYRHHYPDLSINFSRINLGNDSILGNMISLYPQLDYDIYNWKRFNFKLSGGAGISYLDKTFDNTLKYMDDGFTIDFDHSNTAISKHFNMLYILGGCVEFKVSENLKLLAGLKTYHVSNGNIKQPNGGLNIFSSNFGVVFTPTTKVITQRKTCCVPDLDKITSWEIVVTGGQRELYYKIDKKFTTGSVYLSRYKVLTNYLRLGFGADIFYDGAYSYFNFDDATTFRRTFIVSDKYSNRFRMGLSIQPEILFDRFIVGFHSGIYLINPIKNLEPFKEASAGEFIQNPKGLIYFYNINKEDGWLYNRLSFKYKITNKYLISLSIKTHLSNIENLELGAGYIL